MFKLPFYVDAPWIIGVLSLLACLLFVFLRWAYARNIWRIGDVLGVFFDSVFGAAGPEKAQRTGRWFLLTMVVICGATALLGIAVGTGLVENGDSPNQIALEEFIERQSHIQTDRYTWAVGHDAELLKAAQKQYDTWYASFNGGQAPNMPDTVSPRPIKLEVAPSGRKVRITFSDNSQKILDMNEFNFTFSLDLFASYETENPITNQAYGWTSNGLITLSKLDI